MVKYNSKLKFEWDELKNQENIRKHQVSFKEAKSIFIDKKMIRFLDEEHSLDEDRFYAIGNSVFHNKLLVCFCERNENVIRIISARYADKEEKEEYYASY